MPEIIRSIAHSTSTDLSFIQTLFTNNTNRVPSCELAPSLQPLTVVAFSGKISAAIETTYAATVCTLAIYKETRENCLGS